MDRILSVTITPFKFQFYIDLYVQVISYRDLVLQNPHSSLVPDMQRDESALDLACVQEAIWSAGRCGVTPLCNEQRLSLPGFIICWSID